LANDDLKKLLEKTVSHRLISGVSLSLRMRQGDQTWASCIGNIEEDSQYFIASTTKLYTTALTLILEAEGKLSLSDLIVDYIDRPILAGLQTYGGEDHCEKITIQQLLSHTSGIPDYFQGISDDRSSLEKQLCSGVDCSWTLDDALDRARQMKAPFPPGKRGKALYSDTNFQLLGKIVSIAGGSSFEDLLTEHILYPLKLKHTYLFKDPLDSRPLPLRMRNTALSIPLAMTSFGPDGGIVSTTAELMTFLVAFFEGDFFSLSRLKDLMRWNPIFFPLDYGIGISRFRVRWFMMPFMKRPEYIGHSGLSGAFAFYCPTKSVYLAGTVNEISRPSLSFRLLINAVSPYAG